MASNDKLTDPPAGGSVGPMKVNIRLLKSLTRSVGVPSRLPAWGSMHGAARTILPPTAHAGTVDETIPAGTVLQVEMEETASDSPNSLIKGWPVTQGLKEGVHYEVTA